MSYNAIRCSKSMRLQQVFFSKLIKACEQEWIPEADSFYGEPAFTKQLPKGLKKLVYEPKKRKIEQVSIRSKVITK